VLVLDGVYRCGVELEQLCRYITRPELSALGRR